MYEIKRETSVYHEVTKAQAAPSAEMGVPGDISDTFELWLDSVKPATNVLNCQPFSVPETEQRGEAPLTTSTPIEHLTDCELRFNGTLHVDGYFSGNLRSDHGTLVLEESGEINTDIIVGVARINGTVVGNIKARERIELGSTARVIGDLHAPALTVQPGALFEGQCYLLGSSVNGNGRRLQTASRPALTGSLDPKDLRARPKQDRRKRQKAKSRRS